MDKQDGKDFDVGTNYQRLLRSLAAGFLDSGFRRNDGGRTE